MAYNWKGRLGGGVFYDTIAKCVALMFSGGVVRQVRLMFSGRDTVIFMFGSNDKTVVSSCRWRTLHRVGHHLIAKNDCYLIEMSQSEVPRRAGFLSERNFGRATSKCT